MEQLITSVQNEREELKVERKKEKSFFDIETENFDDLFK